MKAERLRIVRMPYELYFNDFTEQYHLLYHHDENHVSVMCRYKSEKKALKEFHNAVNRK